MWKYLAIALLALLVPAAGWAQDADATQCTATQWAATQKGTIKAVWCVRLCSEIDSNNEDCPDTGVIGFDLDELMTDVITFQLAENGTGCSAGSVQIETAEITDAFPNGITHDVGASMDLDGTGTSEIKVEQRAAPLDRFVFGDVSATVTCTGSVDVLIIGHEIAR